MQASSCIQHSDYIVQNINFSMHTIQLSGFVGIWSNKLLTCDKIGDNRMPEL